MSWDWLKAIWESPTVDKVAGYLAGKEDDPSPSVGLETRQHYFSISLECMRLVLASEGFKTFYGVVAGRVGFDLSGGPEAVTAIVSPDALQGLEKKDLGKVIVQTVPICEKIPYIGGSIDLRLALMSLPAQNLLLGVVDVITSVAKAAGVGYVEQTKAFLAPIEKGIDLLSKQGGTEIGLYKVIEEPKAGYFCVARASKKRLDLANCRLSKTWALIDQDGHEVTDVPYFVVRLQAQKHKENFAKIPSLAAAYKRIRNAAEVGNEETANEAFEVFKRSVQWSDDLLDHDRGPMIQLVQTQLHRTFPASPKSATAVRKPSTFPAFEDLVMRDTYSFGQ